MWYKNYGLFPITVDGVTINPGEMGELSKSPLSKDLVECRNVVKPQKLIDVPKKRSVGRPSKTSKPEEKLEIQEPSTEATKQEQEKEK